MCAPQTEPETQKDFNEFPSSKSYTFFSNPILSADTPAPAGYAVIYTKNGTNYDETVRIVGAANGDRFGDKVVMSADGSVLAVGAPRFDVGGVGSDAGHVLIYEAPFTASSTSIAEIRGTDAGGYTGRGLAFSDDGSVLCVGSPNADSDHGSVRVYKRSSSTGEFVSYGNVLTGTSSDHSFGRSCVLSSDGSTLVAGGYSNSDTGDVRIYNDDGTNFVLVDTIQHAHDPDFGRHVSISSDASVIAVGSPSYENLGIVAVFSFDGTTHAQMGGDIVGSVENANFGREFDLNGDGTVLAVGAAGNDATFSGEVRVYSWVDNQWIESNDVLSGDGNGDWFGSSLRLSSTGYTLVVGASQNSISPSTSRVGYARIYNDGRSEPIVPSDDDESSNGGLSSTATALIAVGAGIGGIAVLGAAYMIFFSSSSSSGTAVVTQSTEMTKSRV